MKVIESLDEWKELRPGLSGSLGLVPTMGFLHEGHLSLVRRARKENDHIVVWIFVNPKQFGQNEDLDQYPRDFARDLRLVREMDTDYVLAPTVEDVYPAGFQTHVTVEVISKPLEGTNRPSHFRGVATVVAKMLCLTQAHRAYFGQKDAQQSLVVKRMVDDLGMLTKIVVCPTVREPDGLALSSRNVRLAPAQRKAATVLFRALKEVEAAVAAGERDGETLRAQMRALLAEEPLAEVDYISIADPGTLEECTTVQDSALASLAVRFGDIRLIDNLILNT